MLATTAAGYKTPRWSGSSQRPGARPLAATLHRVEEHRETGAQRARFAALRPVAGAPVPLVAAAAVTLMEAAAGFGYGILELAHLHGQRLVMGVSTAAFFLLVGAGLALCAWALSQARSWGRGPVLLAQLIALGLAWNFRDAGTWVASAALAAPAVIVLAGMLHPATIAVLEEADRSR